MQEVTYSRIRFERPALGVARIVLARPEKRNAQDLELLYDVDAAFTRAAADDDVRAVIIAADGPDFSSGHDLNERWDPTGQPLVTQSGGFGQEGIAGRMAVEAEVFLGLCWRWRNFPKPTIAQVQGRVIAGGLMLIWPCDLIVASRDASFSDPVVAFAAPGVEFFAHPWELGARKAKEMLFTGDAISAEEAHQLGMVNRVVERDELEETTLLLASRIAARPASGLRWAKQSVNQALDIQGQWSAIQAAFSLHQLGHAQNLLVHGQLRDPTGLDIIRREMRAPGRVDGSTKS